MPGIAMSRIKQSVSSTQPEARNSCADEKARAINPNSPSKSGSDSRTDSSSSTADIADHIDHAVKVAGIDHVGIGSDFDGIAGTANGLEDVSKMPSLIAALLNRGYEESELKKILGQNFLRAIREVTGA